MRLLPALPLGVFLTCAQAAPPVFLEDHTWTEVRDAIAAGKTTILVPIGGTEQNGPHMSLGKHNVRARILAARIAERLGDALVAPVVSYTPEGAIDPPTGHMRFPGTISVPHDAFERTLEGAARSLAHHGFRNIVLLGDSGDYRKSLQRVARRLNGDGKRAAAFHVIALDEYYTAAAAGYAETLRKKGFSPEEVGTHAGLADTSLAMGVDPALVRTDRLAAAGAQSGVRGDPRKASAELGREGVDLIIERSVSAIRKAARRP